MENPFDSQTKAEVTNLIKSILGTFTTEYVKYYALGLVKKAEEEAAAEPGPEWKLTERPEGGPSENLKTGILTKKGAIKKNWKKRWFVVRPDYVVEYYENEKAVAASKPKPKGKMFLAGYRVNDDLNSSIVASLEKLAKQMNLDLSELPKPKKYGDTVFEIYHPRRRCYMIEAANKEEKEAWMSMFRTACWYAWGMENRDPIHVEAFQNAIRETRWSLGRWGWWSSGGSETQLLADIINDEIEYQTLGKIYSKIPGPWIIRSKIRDQVLKTIDTLVSAAVNPAWAAMAKVVEELRPKIEPEIKKLVDPLGKQKKEIIEKMKDGVVGVINPIMDEHVIPHLSKLLDIIKSPVVEGYEELEKLLDKQFSVFASKFNPSQPEENFRDLDYFSRWSWWEARPATSRFDVMYEPLWALQTIFSDIYPWSTIYNGQDQLRKILDNAVWTYQVEIKRALEEKSDKPCEEAKNAVIERLKEDAQLATTLYYLKLFKDMIMPALNKLVIPATKVTIDPLAEMIPEPMKQFVDIKDMFDKLLNGIVDDVIKNFLK